MNFAVFQEAFLHRLLPMFSETTLAAIRNLHPEQYLANAVLAGLAALAASVVLYAIGVWLRRMPDKISTAEQKLRIEKIRLLADAWLTWLLILSPTPIGGILIISSGFFAMPRLRTALAIVAAEILWRVAPLL